MAIQGAINQMIQAVGQAAYMGRVGITAAQLGQQKQAVAKANLEARQKQLAEQNAKKKQRRKPYEDVKNLSFDGGATTVGQLGLSNSQLKDLRQQVYGTTRANHDKNKVSK